MQEEVFTKLTLYKRMCYKATELQELFSVEINQYKHLFEDDCTRFVHRYSNFYFLSNKTGKMYSAGLLFFGVLNNYSILNLKEYTIIPQIQQLQNIIEDFKLKGIIRFNIPPIGESDGEILLKFIMRHKFSKYWCLSCNNWKTINKKTNEQRTSTNQVG